MFAHSSLHFRVFCRKGIAFPLKKREKECAKKEKNAKPAAGSMGARKCLRWRRDALLERGNGEAAVRAHLHAAQGQKHFLRHSVVPCSRGPFAELSATWGIIDGDYRTGA